MKKGCFLSVVVAFLATLGCNAQPRSINRTTVGNVDLKRYMGRWYEIARFDHSFERHLEQLRVSFFWIFYSDYNILALGDDYDWALVGSHSHKYLWILSRTPHISEATKEHILGIARVRGYDTDDLIWVKQ